MCSRKKVEVKILLISSPNLNFKLHNWNQTDCLHRTWNPDKIPDSTFHPAMIMWDVIIISLPIKPL